MSQENETKRDHDLHAAMDKLLLEHGAYIPVELLLHEGRLRYSDYEAWRCGEVDSLDDVLLGNPERIFKRLYQASEWAVSLGLEPDSQDYYAWGAKAGGRKLVFLHDNQQSEELLRTHYVRKQDLAPSPGQVSQLDLFLDSGATPIVNDIINALASRRLDDVEILLERLAEREPGHRSRHALDSLFAALYQLENSPDLISPEELLANLEKYLIPLAKELLVGGKPRWNKLRSRSTEATQLLGRYKHSGMGKRTRQYSSRTKMDKVSGAL